MPRADFDPETALGRPAGVLGVRRHCGRGGAGEGEPGDALAPGCSGEEMLAQTLRCHVAQCSKAR